MSKIVKGIQTRKPAKCVAKLTRSDGKRVTMTQPSVNKVQDQAADGDGFYGFVVFLS